MTLFIMTLLLTWEPCAIAQGGKGARGERKRASRVRLTIISDPAECEVFVNKRRRGRTDHQGRLIIRLRRGHYTVRLSREGYLDEKQTIRLTRSQEEQFVLDPVFVDLTILTDPPDAQVYFDEAYTGTTGSDGKLRIPHVRGGEHTVRVQRKGYLKQKQMVKVLPESPSIHIALPPDPVWERIRALERAVAAGHLADAANSYDLLVREHRDHPDIPVAFDILLKGLLAKSRALLSQLGAFGLSISAEQAEELSRFFERIQPERPQDQNLQALMHYWKAKYLAARARQVTATVDKQHFLESQRLEIEKLRKLDPNDASLQYELGWFLFANDREQAGYHFNRALTIQSHWALPHYALAKLQMSGAENEQNKKKRKEKFKRAIVHLEQAIAADPHLAHAYAELCVAHVKIGKKKKAIKNGEQAVKLAPESAYAHYALGFAYYQKGKKEYPKAKRELETALESSIDELDQVMRQLVQQWLGAINRRRR